MPDESETSLPERKRGAGAKIVYDLLRDEILNLGLAPGSPIDEVQLSERFGMSRTPIREALVRLAEEGLVSTLPNRSTMVAAIDFLNLHTYFDALTLMYRATSRLAAQNHRADDLAHLEAYHEEFSRAVTAQDALAMIATNAAFHTAIAEIGRNPYYTGLSKRLLADGRRISRLYYDSYDDKLPQLFVDEHAKLIRAIADRDVAAADRVAKADAQQLVRQIQKLLTRTGDTAVPL
jgi:DNA-binding GntR family transcriptional regulator